jgi:hypothetical protein
VTGESYFLQTKKKLKSKKKSIFRKKKNKMQESNSLMGEKFESIRKFFEQKEKNESMKILFEKSPLKCVQLNVIAYVFVVLFVLGVIQNFYILIAFFLNKTLRSFYHSLIICLILVNFVGILSQYPVVIVSKLKCG